MHQRRLCRLSNLNVHIGHTDIIQNLMYDLVLRQRTNVYLNLDGLLDDARLLYQK
jgi:hypothetical protein